MADFSCRLCDCTASQTNIKKDAKTGSPLSISACERCGLVQQTAIPSDEELRIYYSHNYRTDYKKNYFPKIKYVRRAGIAASDRLRFMGSHLRPPTPRRLLDIGAGGGEFVYLATKAGFEARGIEPNEGYSQFAKEQYGVDIKTMGIDDLAPSSVDIVTLFHVFEHLAHPQSAMQKIADTLTDGGYLFVEVPNILQRDASPHNIYFKAHLFYYSRATLTAAASRWFEPVETDEEGNLRILFRKRSTALTDTELPTAADVQSANRRLAEKGWLEYLFAGGGLWKPFGKLTRSIAEGAVKNQEPKTVLDHVFRQTGLESFALPRSIS